MSSEEKLKKIINALSLLLLLSLYSTSFAADTNVHGRLYADWNLNSTNGSESANSFNIKRAYITIKSKLSNNTSVRITTDVRETSSFDGYSVILKYGYVDWKPEFGNGNFKVRYGMQPTLYIDNMNKLWGRRYLQKTVGDLNKYLTTSDLGIGAFVNLGEKGKTGYLALQIFNGTKYTSVKEKNKNKDISAFVLLKPLANNENFKRSKLLAQAYIGTKNVTLMPGVDTTATGADMVASQFKNQIISLGGILGYSNKLDLGFDANFRTSGSGYNDITGTEIADKKSSGLSFFGTLYFKSFAKSESFADMLNIFGRFDILDPNTEIDNDGKSLFIAGMECNPTKGFKASINFRTVSYEAAGVDSESHVYVNTLFKF